MDSAKAEKLRQEETSSDTASSTKNFDVVNAENSSPSTGRLRSWFKRVQGDAAEIEKKRTRDVAAAQLLINQRWGDPGSPHYELVLRYWQSTHMKQHWDYLMMQDPQEFKRKVEKGYCEPIPTAWVKNRRLASRNTEGSFYETPGEERLYYLLNNGIHPELGVQPRLRPLNINRDRSAILRRGNERNAACLPLNPRQLALYRSPGDIFMSDPQIKSYEYSLQVTNVIYEARTRALHELAEGILLGTDHLETMLLIDVSGSMAKNPHGGIIGPDGIRRYHDQPSNISLVEHLVHRALHHMIPRAQMEHPTQVGIDTVTFSSTGQYIGQLSTNNFKQDWSRVQVGGRTQVMQGWQVVKNTYFQHQHDEFGHGRWDPVFGWQPTPNMPKLSLLVFLDGEALDMDEFELEILGETWAYVTIALVGMEGCPHHHSHAIELERVAKFNPHVGFFDVHGRVCERMAVQDLLQSVYPVDPPAYEEVLKPEYDLPAERLPAYSK